MSAEIAATLDGAADMIRRNGLYKGSFCDDGALRLTDAKADQACCAYGAINFTANGKNARLVSPASEAAHDALCAHLGISGKVGDAVADWNDAEDRTAEQVIAALEGAAQAEREAAS